MCACICRKHYTTHCIAVINDHHFNSGCEVCFYMQHAHKWPMHGTHRYDSEVQFPMLAGMLPESSLEYKYLPHYKVCMCECI